MTDRPTLGQKIRAKAVVEGRHQLLKGGKQRKWVREEKEIEGVYMGYRTVQEGSIHREYVDGFNYSGRGTDYYHYFEPKKYLEVWLIVVDPRQNPLHVLPEDVTNRGLVFEDWLAELDWPEEEHE